MHENGVKACFFCLSNFENLPEHSKFSHIAILNPQLSFFLDSDWQLVEIDQRNQSSRPLLDDFSPVSWILYF